VASGSKCRNRGFNGGGIKRKVCKKKKKRVKKWVRKNINSGGETTYHLQSRCSVVVINGENCVLNHGNNPLLVGTVKENAS